MVLLMKFEKVSYFIKIRLDRFAFLVALNNFEQAVIKRFSSFSLRRVLNAY